MTRWSRTRWAAVVAVIVVVAAAPSCDVRVAGTLCAARGSTARDATYVLVCRQGRWRRTITLQRAALAVAAAIRARTPTELTVGSRHTCAAMLDASVRCWGANEEGQLGDGSSVDRTTPTPARSVTASWTTADDGSSPGGATGAGPLVAGDAFTCATTGGRFQLFHESDTYCWGDGSVGQMGDGLGIGRDAAGFRALLPRGVHHVVAGDRHACASTDFDGVWCWGSNSSGQLGDGNVGGATATPVRVAGTVGGLVAAGRAHSCAWGPSGTWCWGANGLGQLGDGTTIDRPGAVAVALDHVVSVAAGGDHTCALLEDGTVRCWGANEQGQVGAAAGRWSSTPVPVAGLDGVVRLAAGSAHTCAVRTDGTAWCWGGNLAGQLGDGTTTMRFTPVRVGGLSGVTSIAAGGGHTCAIVGASAMCRGANQRGQLGTGVPGDRSTPTPVAF